MALVAGEQLVHTHLLARMQLTRPIGFSEVHGWLLELPDALGMRILAGPFVVRSDEPDNSDATGVAIISTSHISIHSFEESGIAQLDIYS